MATGYKAKVSLLIALGCVFIAGCQQPKQEVPLVAWKLDSSANAFLDPEIPLSGYRIRPPKNYSFMDNSQNSAGGTNSPFNGYGQWITWVYNPDASERKQYLWFDSRRPPVETFMGPIAPGQTQLVQTQLYVLQPFLKMFIQDAPGKNSEETLTKLYESFIGRDPDMAEKDVSHSPPEFGLIHGLRFARGTWKARIGLKANVASTSLTGYKYAPAEGICYVTIIYGQAIMFVGLAPAGESTEAIKQSILSFHKI
ncbi:MAG: hypothetical protein C5B53_13785 [Candidatus Melainabacteria bacterium]|nr:MAG: hypothetical protein C5B53_13785 [Candidatus Melainabacteria bacterium]